jgi:hypothetical protein
MYSILALSNVFFVDIAIVWKEKISYEVDEAQLGKRIRVQAEKDFILVPPVKMNYL